MIDNLVEKRMMEVVREKNKKREAAHEVSDAVRLNVCPECAGNLVRYYPIAWSMLFLHSFKECEKCHSRFKQDSMYNAIKLKGPK